MVILGNWAGLEDIPGHLGVGDLLPRMTDRKREEMLDGMGFSQRGVLSLRFDGRVLREGGHR